MTVSILKSLRRDHANLARLMRIAQQELDELHEGREPDYQLLEDVLRYITGYADVHHHPAEDRVYAVLVQEAPELAEDLGVITTEHDTLVRRGLALRADVEAVAESAIVRRDLLAQEGRDYLQALEKHMRAEESGLFPAAERVLSPSHWAHIGAASVRAPDPLFGESVSREYAGLRRRIETELR